MTICSKKKLNIFYAFLTLSAFTLTGCRMGATIEVYANGETKEVLTLEDDNGQIALIGRTCENLKNVLPKIGSFAHGGGTKMEDITSPRGPPTCKFTSDKSLNKGDGLVDNGDSYGFAISKPPMEATETYEGIRIKLTIQIPLKVIKTNIGKIEGNKVIIGNLDYLSTGIPITFRKERSASSLPAPTSVSGRKSDTATSKNDNDGFPVWGWDVIGAVVAAAGAVVVLLARRKKHYPQSN